MRAIIYYYVCCFLRSVVKGFVDSQMGKGNFIRDMYRLRSISLEYDFFDILITLCYIATRRNYWLSKSGLPTIHPSSPLFFLYSSVTSRYYHPTWRCGANATGCQAAVNLGRAGEPRQTSGQSRLPSNDNIER